jgi:hypothetical protein
MARSPNGPIWFRLGRVRILRQHASRALNLVIQRVIIFQKVAKQYIEYGKELHSYRINAATFSQPADIPRHLPGPIPFILA